MLIWYYIKESKVTKGGFSMKMENLEVKKGERQILVDAQSPTETREITDINQFVKKVYQLFAGSLLAGAVGAYVGLPFASAMASNKLFFWGAVIVEFILLIALQIKRKSSPLNLFLLFGFTFMSGFTLAPLLGAFIGRGWGNLIAEAFILTSVAFFGLTWFAMVTKKDFSGWGKALFVTLIVLIVASILNIFLQLPLLQMGIAVVSAILFSFFILYDTQNIIRGNVETPIEGAVILFLDFVNLFVSLLQILGFLNDD